jgi:glycine/D-amino acid oxidase-like deaminating enzyme
MRVSTPHMRTRYGLSPWIEAVPRGRRPDFPRLKGELTADVVIIGGGLTGCLTAHGAAAAGLKTIVIEANRIGQGRSGYGAGLLLPTPGPSFRDVVAAHGLRVGRRIFESWRRASIDAAAQLKRLGVRCRVEPHPSVVIGQQEALLRKEFEAWEGAGLDAQWLASTPIAQVTGLSAAGGIRVKDAFTLDPYAACVGVAAVAVRKRGTFFERTEVTKIQVTPRSVDVVCGAGTVRSQKVVIATGTPGAAFKPLRRHFTARESYLVLTEPVPARLRREFGRGDAVVEDMHTPRHRLVWTADGRVLIGGADQAAPARGHDAVLVQRTGQLMYELLMMYPAIAGLRPEYGWSVPAAETADRLMFIGPHRNYPRHLFALGSGGDSVTGAFLAAGILTRALTGKPAKGDDDLGWAARRLS